MYRDNLLCLILLLAITPVVQAETIGDLISAGELEARVVVETAPPLFQKAPIVIAVEVGTPHHFSRGTRVRDFTVPGTLVRPASNFAFNETRRRGGDTWAFQSWSFRLYSERTGTLRIPTLTTFVSVDTETHGVVEGEVRLEVPPLEIEAPPGTRGLASWVATTGFEADESWEGVLEEYQIGDAITRIRRFTINDAPAMAILASPQIELDGVQVYNAPALVDDKAVRGSLVGVREERVVFTVEVGGTHTIPGHRVHWFNLDTNKVEQIDFPGRTLDVAGSAVQDAAATPEPRGKTEILFYGGLVVLGAALGYWLLRWVSRRAWFHYLGVHLEAWTGHRRTKKAFMRAVVQRDSRRCLALLYEVMSEHSEWQLSTACAADPKLSAISAALLAHAYGEGEPPHASELRRLWEACARPKTKRNDPDGLRLNPGSSQQP